MLLESDEEPGTTVTVINKRTGTMNEARVDENGIVREGPPPHGAAYSDGAYALVDDDE